MNQRLLKAVRVFNQTACTGSMSQAARELNMTVSAVSQQLQKLEEEIGLSLFVRNTRSMSLTEAGELYYQTTRKIADEAELMQSKLAMLKQQPQGVIKLVAPAGFGGGLLSGPLKQLMSEFPDMGVHLTLTDEPCNLVRQGADLGLCIGPLSDSQMVARQLAEWQMCLCVSRQHPLADSPPKHPSQLHAQDYISHIREQNTISQLSHPGGELFELKQRRLMVNNMQSLIQMIKDNVGFGLVPKIEVEQALADGELVELLTDWTVPNYTVHAVTPQRDFIPAKTQTAIKLLKAHFNAI
ncbi:LysR family transcriptional regulator [Idiomarina aquatica]|uniref:LysR family transcriptional regulator n=1 Tax=Idiomarina aquatica TaxID=1327752 RepID=A0A4R6PKG9_9GAMM|nr:LysR family transcriptional regulator [Idiomarina aquatica]TDP38296.1 LysR family transcriptional regulator [Idiomarina aquatica]